MKKNILALALVLGLLSVGLVVNNAVAVNAQTKPAAIPDRYIIVLQDNIHNTSNVAQEHAQQYGLSIDHVYNYALKGYAAVVPASKLSMLKKDQRIKFISQDRVVSAFKGKPVKPTPTPEPSPEQVIPTGIARIGMNNNNKGTNIGVAVIDTGIDLTHPDLTANIVADTSCVRGAKNGNDDNGHGSHVAGTIAAVDNTIGVRGVAPEAKLIAVKVLDRNGSGTWSSVICGIDWVTANSQTYNIKVANMSLGGGGTSDNNCGNTNNDALHQAVCQSTQTAGVTYVVAAGNEASNTENAVPAAYNDTVITISALADSDGAPYGLGPNTSWGADDTFATFSNYGAAVDLGAPGVDILSTWKGGDYNTISGTSMATPHAAGAAVLYLNSHPGSLWTQVRDALISGGEALGVGHTDPSNLHPEPILQAGNL